MRKEALNSGQLGSSSSSTGRSLWQEGLHKVEKLLAGG